MLNTLLLTFALAIVLLPLAGSLIAGLWGKRLGRTLTHRTLVTFVGVAFLLSCYLFKVIVLDVHPAIEGTIYTWGTLSNLQLDVAFLLDPLSVIMTTIVLFVSLMVHIY